MTAPTSKHAPDYQQEGYHAYAQGERPQACPYRWGTDPFAVEQWYRGYAWARTDKALANRELQRSKKP